MCVYTRMDGKWKTEKEMERGHKQIKQNKTKHQGKKNDLSIICISERDGQG